MAVVCPFLWWCHHPRTMQIRCYGSNMLYAADHWLNQCQHKQYYSTDNKLLVPCSWLDGKSSFTTTNGRRISHPLCRCQALVFSLLPFLLVIEMFWWPCHNCKGRLLCHSFVGMRVSSRIGQLENWIPNPQYSTVFLLQYTRRRRLTGYQYQDI